MRHIAVIGAGITGVTTAYALIRRGYKVTVIDRNRYPASETTFANGGQLSASNAEVWNSWSTIIKGIGWMFKRLAYDDRRFRRGAPTAREITITDPRDFEQEKAHFIVGFLKAAQGPAQITQPIHPFFGKLTNDQWGVLLYKHLDHHFRQFGV